MKKTKIPRYTLKKSLANMPQKIMNMEFELSRGVYESVEYHLDKPLIIIVENEKTRNLFERKIQ